DRADRRPAAEGGTSPRSRPIGGCAGYRAVHRRGITGTPLATHPRRLSAEPGCDARAAPMSDPIDHPPERHVDPRSAPAPEYPLDRHPWLPWLTAAGFLVLIAAMSYAWRHPDTEVTDALGRQLAAVEGRVARLEQRPPPQIPDLAPLAARITALEQRP